MRSSATTVILAAFTIMSASGCEQKTPKPGPASGQAVASEPADQASQAKAEEPQETAGQPNQAAREPSGAEPARETPVLVDDNGRTRVSVKTPEGASVSLAVPAGWSQLPRRDKATLVEMGAPAGTAISGVKTAVIAKKFDGSQNDLVESNRTHLESFVSINNEGPKRIGSTDAYEFSVSWETPTGTRKTTERIVATGNEAITVTCQVPPSALGSVGPLCDEIYGTLSIQIAERK